MDANIRALLTSSDPTDRKRGIQQLVQSGDPDTLNILHRLYKNDTDPGVRRLAAHYGKQLQEGSGDKSKPAKKAPRDPQGAQVALRKAMDNMLNLDYAAAKREAQRAFMLDPSLQHDEEAVNLAADITGAPAALAVERLMADAPGMGSAYAGGMALGEAPQGRVSWGKALLDVGIYAFLSTLPFLIMSLLFATVANAVLQDLDAPFNAFGFSISLSLAVFIFTALGLMIWMAIVHFCASSILKGRGYYTNLLHNTRNPLIVYLIVSTVIGVGGFFLLLGSGVSAFSDVFVEFAENVDPDTISYWLETGDSTALDRELAALDISNSDLEDVEQRMEQFQGINSLIQGINGLVWLGFMLWLSVSIGKTYAFGGGKGCASIILSYILPMVVMCGCAFCAFFLLGSMGQG